MNPKDSDFVMNKLQNLRESALKDGMKPNRVSGNYSMKATPGKDYSFLKIRFEVLMMFFKLSLAL